MPRDESRQAIAWRETRLTVDFIECLLLTLPGAELANMSDFRRDRPANSVDLPLRESRE
jgi:hypothetical protein